MQKTIEQIHAIPGWCSDEKAKDMMQLIYKEKLSSCIEIGVLAGRSLLPIARALEYRKTGKVYAIDAWNPSITTEGLRSDDPNFHYWANLDYESLFLHCSQMLSCNHLCQYCEIIRASSKEAATRFEDKSIDLIHFDGNHTEACVLDDVKLYFAKLKNGGFIILNDPCWLSMRSALVYLLERSKIIKGFESRSNYLILQKDPIKIENANLLTTEIK